MADRVRFRDAVTRRFISRETAEREGGLVDILSPVSGAWHTFDAADYLNPPEEIEPPEPQWFESETERGGVWQSFNPDFNGDFTGFDPPEWATEYRLIVEVDGDPDYPRGHASTGWQGVAAWPPTMDMVKGVTPSRVHQVRFER